MKPSDGTIIFRIFNDISALWFTHTFILINTNMIFGGKGG